MNPMTKIIIGYCGKAHAWAAQQLQIHMQQEGHREVELINLNLKNQQSFDSFEEPIELFILADGVSEGEGSMNQASAKTWAQKISGIFADNKNELESIKLLNPEAGAGDPPFALQLVGEMHELGFDRLKIHAPQKPFGIKATGAIFFSPAPLFSLGWWPAPKIKAYLYPNQKSRDFDELKYLKGLPLAQRAFFARRMNQLEKSLKGFKEVDYERINWLDSLDELNQGFHTFTPQAHQSLSIDVVVTMNYFKEELIDCEAGLTQKIKEVMAFLNQHPHANSSQIMYFMSQMIQKIVEEDQDRFFKRRDLWQLLQFHQQTINKLISSLQPKPEDFENQVNKRRTWVDFFIACLLDLPYGTLLGARLDSLYQLKNTDQENQDNLMKFRQILYLPPNNHFNEPVWQAVHEYLYLPDDALPAEREKKWQGILNLEDQLIHSKEGIGGLFVSDFYHKLIAINNNFMNIQGKSLAARLGEDAILKKIDKYLADPNKSLPKHAVMAALKDYYLDPVEENWMNVENTIAVNTGWDDSWVFSTVLDLKRKLQAFKEVADVYDLSADPDRPKIR